MYIVYMYINMCICTCVRILPLLCVCVCACVCVCVCVCACACACVCGYNNALAVHVQQSSHNILWDEASVVTREGHWTKRKIKERIAIKELNGEKPKSRQRVQITNTWFTLNQVF